MSASGIKAGHPSFGPPYRRRATFGHLPGRGRALAACHRSRVGECCNSEVTNCKPAEYECSTLAGVIGSWTLADYQFRQVAVDQLWIDHLSFAHSFLSQIVNDNSVESIHSCGCQGVPWLVIAAKAPGLSQCACRNGLRSKEIVTELITRSAPSRASCGDV